MSTMENRIQAEIHRITTEYGKVGLLIDDSLDAPTRIARAFYGSEALPQWWMQLRSLEHASCSLDAFHEIFGGGERGRLRGLLIFDRYLPVRCGEPVLPIPWDKADSKLSEDDERAANSFREKVKVLQASKPSPRPGAIPAYRLLYMTSFQPISSELDVATTLGNSFSVPWRGRSVEILQEERRAIQESESWRGLLRFGPEKDAPVVREERRPVTDLEDSYLAQAKWHAETWQIHLRRIAGLLRAGHPVILLTGAGASLASAPTAPGMPSTDALLEEACAQLEIAKAAERAESREEAVRALGCACESRRDSTIPLRFWKAEEVPDAPIDWLIDEFRQTGSIAGLRCTLEELFSRTLHKERVGRNSFDDFHSSFRSALYRWDYGFAYHHWLLARLPWQGIITTNFDGFHERAAAAAATLPWLRNEKRLEPLRYANPVTWQEGRPAFSLGALFKPYGSLYAPDGKIALSQEEIDGLRNRFKSALDATVEKRIAGAPGALVVLGHSMRDPSIGHLFDTIAELLSYCDVFWVDPSAFERSWKKKDEGSSWEKWMWERVLRKGQGGGPIPATALEFACDLWDAFFQT